MIPGAAYKSLHAWSLAAQMSTHWDAYLKELFTLNKENQVAYQPFTQVYRQQ